MSLDFGILLQWLILFASHNTLDIFFNSANITVSSYNQSITIRKLIQFLSTVLHSRDSHDAGQIEGVGINLRMRNEINYLLHTNKKVCYSFQEKFTPWFNFWPHPIQMFMPHTSSHSSGKLKNWEYCITNFRIILTTI